MAAIDLKEHFDQFDSAPSPEEGFAGAIISAVTLCRQLHDEAAKIASQCPGAACAGCGDAIRDLQPLAYIGGDRLLCVSCITKVPKLAEDSQPTGGMSARTRAVRLLGSLAQLWKADELPFPQKPSTLGQLLVMGGVGATAGYAAGSLANRIAPNQYVDFSVPGAVLGGAAGSAPAFLGGYLNTLQGKPVLTESFWDSPDKPEFRKQASVIPVDRFQDIIWSDMSTASRLPTEIQAAASGLVMGAANLPGKPPASQYVTPSDLARMAMGLGGGAAAGYLFGKSVGSVFGLSPKAQNLIIGSGAFAGLLKSLTPKVYGAGG